MTMSGTSSTRRAFSLTELLVVIGVLVLLIGLLLPALASVSSTGWMTSSMNKMRNIGTAMSAYASDSGDTILASQFNHAADPFQGQVRTGPAFGGAWFARGTWADTLWTRNEMGVFPEADETGGIGNDYHNDSPDKKLYEFLGDNFDNALRSAGPNTKNAPGPVGGGMGNTATPYGIGAQEIGWPGYFAANNFFNADAMSGTFNGRWSTGQIRSPARSMYLVDSFAGETIEDEDATEGDAAVDPFNNEVPDVGQVDFRYSDLCLMLFLDGHVDSQSEWLDLTELEQDRKVRVRALNKR